jgi:putative flippase GtrA
MESKITLNPNLRRFALFALVGTLGFVVESSTILSLVLYAQASPMSAKFIAFPIAVLVTWILNRYLTFTTGRKNRPLSELFKYFQTAIGGMFVNLLAFFTVLTINQNAIIVIFFATASGALAGLLVNYLGCSYFVFSKTKADGT